MRIRTDDEVYRVDAVWLGPPRATFPWRARYVAWGVGIVVFLAVLAVERRMGIGFGFFSTAWAVVITIAVTRVICSRISHERPLSAVMVMWLRELTAPRKAAEGRGGAVSAARIKVNAGRPTQRQSGRPKRSEQAGQSFGAGQDERAARRPSGSAATGDRAGFSSKRAHSKEGRGVRSRARS